MLTGIPSQATIEKAAGIVHGGRVHPAGLAAIYHVGGESAVYRVVVFDDDSAFCPCPAMGRCSHELAALLVHSEAVDRVAA